VTRQPHVRPRSAAARYQWEVDHPRTIPPAVIEIIAGLAGGTIAALAMIGALYLVGIFG
jgi:hypothetical protein